MGVNGEGWGKAQIIGYAIAIIVGAAAGGPGYRALDPPRADPYTSVDAALDNHELDRMIRTELQKVTDRMELLMVNQDERLDRMDIHNAALIQVVADLPPDVLLERMTRAEEQVKYLFKIYDRLEPKGSDSK